MARYRALPVEIEAEQVADWTQIRMVDAIDTVPPGSFVITDADGWQSWMREADFMARYEAVPLTRAEQKAAAQADSATSDEAQTA